MCREETVAGFRLNNARKMRSPGHRFVSICTLSLAAVAAARAQQIQSQQISVTQASMTWKRIAGTNINAGLAGAASGPVTAVWYAPGTSGLLAQTASGRIFETADFIHWRLNTTAVAPPSVPNAVSQVSPGRLPEPGAKVQAAATRFYAAAATNVYASDDNGRTWLNLTGFNGRSVIGGGFTALAIAPANSQEIAAANRFGVWRSLDGGLSWQSLNEELPNLLVRKLIDRRTVVIADGSLLDVSGGSWTTVAGADPEINLRARFGTAAKTDFTAAAQSGLTAYGGTSDGKLLVSRDGGAHWLDPVRTTGAAAITRIWVDSDRPDVALAAAGSHLFRTINGGLFWDEVTGALSSGQIHGIAADRVSGVVYAATDGGVFSSNLSLTDAGPAATNWKSVARDLPAAPAWDVRLSADNTLTVALDGYGVFESPAPHRTRGVRIVSGADLTDRPAAPGSLISVLGAKVQTVKNQGVAFPVLASSEQSSQLQVPFEAASGTFSLSLESGTGQWTVPLIVKDAAPAIFVDSDGAPLILDAASGLVVDPRIAVYANSTVQVLATGLGKVTPEWQTGVPAPLDAPPAVTGTVTAFLDGAPLEVTRAVLAPGYVGYYLVELQIPSIVNRGASELRIVMNGVESNRVKLYLEPNTPLQ
jgi:uncharacterized protein (TIGR03437 family)